MKLPRDLSGAELVQHLTSRRDYRKIHQVGSHVTLETDIPSKQRIGTLSAILTAAARHKGVERERILAGLR